MISPLDISASALSAQRLRMNVISSNIANANTTRDEYGRPNPYRRLMVSFQEAERGGKVSGVAVSGVNEDPNPFKWVHQPDHPDAIKDPSNPRVGQVRMPRINQVQEMGDMMLASRAYEANLTAMQVTKSIGQSVSRIIG